MHLKNIFKSMFFVSLIDCCFSNYLHAIEQQKTLQSTDDTFIRNFVRRIESNKVSYDGKNLILYADPGSHTNGIFWVGVAISTIFGIACLSSKDKEIKVVGGSAAFLLDLILLISLIRSSYAQDINTPYITINDYKIKNWNDRGIEWKKVFRLKHRITKSNEYIVHLCDEYLNSLFTIEDWHNLPISFDNLIAILEHYIKKNKQKK